MALISKRTERLLHPTEADTWFEVRVPLSAGDMAGMRTDGQQVGMTLDLLAKVITAWSYPVPVTLENVELLDLDTFTFLNRHVLGESGVRDDDEKKDSDGSSSPSMSPRTPEENPSPTSLATS